MKQFFETNSGTGFSTIGIMTFFLFLSFAFSSPKTYERFCHQSLESFPIRQGGRVKPLGVHAYEILRYITGSSTINGQSSVIGYCLLSMESLGAEKLLSPRIPVFHPKLREFLALSKGGKEELSAHDALNEFTSLQQERARIKEDGSYKSALEKLLGRISAFGRIVKGQDWLLPIVEEREIGWRPLSSLSGIQNSPPFMQTLRDHYKAFGGASIRTELLMRKLSLPYVSLVLSFAALGFLSLTKSRLFSLITAGLSLSAQTALIIFRILVSGRAPITNMYETVLFSGFGTLLLGMMLSGAKRTKIFLFAGLAYNVMTLMMMIFATAMLSDSISPLVPVLRDNFWLSTHVTTVILSYGAFALSWILSNTAMIKNALGTLDKGEERHYCEMTYTCLKFGMTLLAAGVILGGVWADYSWGRFWGWDPKETWSLIVLCLYTAILHGRYTRWIPPHRFLPLTALAFLSVMMAWFGVNYILASGLHSYGFSEGGAIFLGSFFAIQLIISGATFRRFQT